MRGFRPGKKHGTVRLTGWKNGAMEEVLRYISSKGLIHEANCRAYRTIFLLVNFALTVLLSQSFHISMNHDS